MLKTRLTVASGGATYSNSVGAVPTLTASVLDGGGKWSVSYRNDGASGVVTAYAYALCAA